MWYRFLDVARALIFDLPSSVREYSHRVDRIARAGRGGSALPLVAYAL
jgi:superfamily II DNA/RNA helicase